MLHGGSNDDYSCRWATILADPRIFAGAKHGRLCNLPSSTMGIRKSPISSILIVNFDHGRWTMLDEGCGMGIFLHSVIFLSGSG